MRLTCFRVSTPVVAVLVSSRTVRTANFHQQINLAWDVPGVAVNTPLVNFGLWALSFGSGANGLDPNTLDITAGINGDRDGLFNSIRSLSMAAIGPLLTLVTEFTSAITSQRLREP